MSCVIPDLCHSRKNGNPDLLLSCLCEALRSNPCLLLQLDEPEKLDSPCVMCKLLFAQMFCSQNILHRVELEKPDSAENIASVSNGADELTQLFMYNASMSESLYRKYRPQKFDEVIGQAKVVSVLEQAIKDKTIAHAYLFAGSRGTGKTSIARIFAREIGCAPHDIYEMDAASNRSVDDARELRDGVSVVPLTSPYKVYIIDEAHMLTKEAFNTLLKTLEEPPKHVVFVFATTELEKVPETIYSRCQTFIFETPTAETLREAILKVAKKEKYSIEKESAELIARVARGSYRDAYGALQKVMTVSADKKLTAEEVASVLGTPKGQFARIIAKSIVLGTIDLGLSALKDARNDNVNAKLLVESILDIVRASLAIKVSPKGHSVITESLSPEDLAVAEEIEKTAGDRLTPAILVRMLEIALLSEKINDPFVALEVILFERVGK